MNSEQFNKGSEEVNNPWEIHQNTENKTGVEASIGEYPPIDIPKELYEEGINREESEDIEQPQVKEYPPIEIPKDLYGDGVGSEEPNAAEQDTEPEGELSEMGKECDKKLFEILNNNAENEDYKKKVGECIADARGRLDNMKDEELTTRAVDNVMKEMMERIEGLSNEEEAKSKKDEFTRILRHYERLFSETTEQPPMSSENSQNKATVNFFD